MRMSTKVRGADDAVILKVTNDKLVSMSNNYISFVLKLNHNT